MVVKSPILAPETLFGRRFVVGNTFSKLSRKKYDFKLL